VALDAGTGKMLWYYQFVHHDIWDYDASAPPALIDVTHNGKKIPAVVQVTKMGLVFIFDRRSGKSIYGVEERKVPESEVPGEASWPTQPFPLKPPPIARNSFGREEIATVTPEHKAFCTELFTQEGGMHNDGPYTPYGTELSVIFPGTLGGANWGGVSFDPVLGYVFVNSQDLGSIGQMVKRPEGSPTEYARTSSQGPTGRFWNPKNFWPCQQPPWGKLYAIDANKGEIAWNVPLGIVEELEARGVHNTGTPNLGGSIATAGGLVFIGATNDRRFRAFDSSNGKELWVTKIDASAHSTPITYLGHDGKQYVVVTATGGNYNNDDSADTLIAFSLP
jgi:quinoprotein glucose dehydrogenase